MAYGLYLRPRRPASYDVVVQPRVDEDGNLQPMVIDSKGRIIVDSYGYIWSTKACPQGQNCVGQKTSTNGIQEAINYVLNSNGGTVYIKRGDYYFPPITTNSVPIQIPLQNYQWSSFKIIGDGYGTRLHLPVNKTTNNLWLFDIGQPGASATAAVSPLPEIRGITFVNDVNNGSAPVGPMVTYATNGEGNGIILTDVTYIDNPNAEPGIQAMYWTWFNNMYGVLIRGFTFLSNNPTVLTSVLVFDSVTYAKVIGCYMSHNIAYGGWQGTAISPATGSVVVDDCEIYGFYNAFGWGGSDGPTTLQVSNSIIGSPRGGSQVPSGNRADVWNLLAGTSPGATGRVLIDNTVMALAGYVLQTSDYTQVDVYMNNVYWQSDGGGSIINVSGSNSSGTIRITNSRIGISPYTLPNGAPPLWDNNNTQGGAVFNIIAEDNDFYLNIYSYTDSSGFYAGFPGSLGATYGYSNYIIRRNRIIYQGNTNTLFGIYTNYGTSGKVIIEDNEVITSGSSQSTLYVLGLNASGSIPVVIIRNNRFDKPQTLYNIAPTNPGNMFVYNNLNAPASSLATPSVPSSGTAQQNTYPIPVYVFLYGGTVTEIQITKGGITYTVFSNSSGASLSGQVYRLEPGDSITITYSSAPSWVWVPAS